MALKQERKSNASYILKCLMYTNKLNNPKWPQISTIKEHKLMTQITDLQTKKNYKLWF